MGDVVTLSFSLITAQDISVAKILNGTFCYTERLFGYERLIRTAQSGAVPIATPT